MEFAVASALLTLALPTQQAPPRAPGDWQQGVEYRIEARLDESTETLEGRARVLYRNNAPEALDEFYFHLYLNAFRPNSAWARTDLAAGITTFQDLGPDDHGFERVLEMTVGGTPVTLRYPFAPDSTIVGFDLPDPVEPGATLTVEYHWRARASVVPRRQGRRGRHYDFAQWYPRVVVYDDEGWRVHPLYRAGEFYGEFATYDVTLELREDQVVAATGVPIAGDPGWQGASALGTGPPTLQRAWYGTLEGPICVERGSERICDAFPAKRLPAAESSGLLMGDSPEGWKRVRWWAEDVHHFAWSASPDYVYEQGRWDDVVIHVLYQPGDEEAWGGGVAVRRTAVALEWLDRVFGDYPYPQVTNVHRIEGGGTEFPMMVMDGSASQGLILHEVGHIYAYGALGNNEWYEGWLDEGMSSFQTAWFAERSGAGTQAWRGAQIATLLRDLTGTSEPVVLPAEDYADYDTYASMIYTKGSLVLWMLREMAGEEAFGRILRIYYERNRFQHVDSEDFQAVAEEVLGEDLDWFFGPWLHGTGLVDYALTDVDVTADGESWVSVVTIERLGDVVMPVPIRLSGPADTLVTVLDGTAIRGRRGIRTRFLPTHVEIDPDGSILDWNVRNNHWTPSPFAAPALEVRIDHPLEPLPTQWRRVPVRGLPLGWFNDAGGWVAGGQLRWSQLGLADRGLLRVGLPAIAAGDRGGLGRGFDPGSIYARFENPVRGGRPRMGTTVEALAGEGRVFLAATARRLRTGPSLSGSPAGLRAFGSVYWVYDDTYLVPGRWTLGNKVGLEAGLGREGTVGPSEFPFHFDLFASAGFDTQNRRWLRSGLTVVGEGPVFDSWRARLRGFAGVAVGWDARDQDWNHATVPRERMFFLAGGDPFRAMSNPWTRSRGSTLDEEGFVPGGGELRGFHPGLPVPRLAAVGAELASPVLLAGPAAERFAPRLVAFGSVGLGGRIPIAGSPDLDEDRLPDDLHDRWRTYGSAGLGLEVGPEGSPIRFRLDLPILISDPGLATGGTDATVGLRWTVAILGG